MCLFKRLFKKEQNPTCIVCLEDMTIDRHILSFNFLCGHIICELCLVRLPKRRTLDSYQIKCPICMKYMKARVIYLNNGYCPGCNINYMSLRTNLNFYKTNCNHIYCSKCLKITPYNLRSGYCKICKVELKINQKVFLL